MREFHIKHLTFALFLFVPSFNIRIFLTGCDKYEWQNTPPESLVIYTIAAKPNIYIPPRVRHDLVVSVRERGVVYSAEL